MDFTIKTDYNFFFIPAILILSVFISYFYYKNSKLEPFQKKLFSILRFLSVFFILLMLLSPVISFLNNTSEKPVNVYLIDNSASLTIDSRNEVLKDVLKNKVNKIASDNSENIYYLYSENLYKEISRDEISEINYSGFNNFQTNLNSTFTSLREKLQSKNLSSVTIISDGMINEGGNPSAIAKSMNVPVNYILIGDTIQKNDLVISNVSYNKSVFVESVTPVRVEINSYNYDSEIKVNLYDEDKIAETKTLKVTSDKINYELIFSLKSDNKGIKKYKVEVTGPENEITLKNNSEEFFINFTDNKFKILLIAGGPSPDIAFIEEGIKSINNFETTILTQKSANEFYEGAIPNLSDFDSYILVGFPTSVTNISLLNQLKDNLEKNNSSLLFFASRNTDYKKLSLLEDYLPFKSGNISESESETSVKSVGSPDQEIFKNSLLISKVNNFPNIFKTATVFSANAGAETFLLSGSKSEPVLIIENTDKNKSAAFLAYGIYKWRLNNKSSNAVEVLNYIISGALVAITDRETKNKFKIETSKPVYSEFEDVIFNSNLNNYEVKGGENISVRVKGMTYDSSFNLTKRNNIFFRGGIKIRLKGDYTYTAELKSGGNTVQTIEGRFIIGENNFEYKNTRADNTILSSISFGTNGNNFSSADAKNINENLELVNEKSKVEYKSLENFELNINPYYLLILILLLCMEWFLRKRNNLP